MTVSVLIRHREEICVCMGIYPNNVAAMEPIPKWLMRDGLSFADADRIFNNRVGAFTSSQHSYKCQYTGWIFTINQVDFKPEAKS